MNRLFGMMPASEIEITKKFVDKNGLMIIIQAGTSGWTIIFADSSIDYEDCEDLAINNFNKAYKAAKNCLGTLVPYNAQLNKCDVKLNF